MRIMGWHELKKFIHAHVYAGTPSRKDVPTHLEPVIGKDYKLLQVKQINEWNEIAKRKKNDNK